MTDLELGLSLFTGKDEDGFPIAQFDGHGDDPLVSNSPAQHAFGFWSRARDPELDDKKQPREGKACALWRFTDGDDTIVMFGTDPRYLETVPHPKKGGTVVYCAPGSFQSFDGDDGTITTYVPVPGDKAHVQTIGLDGAGAPYVGLAHADGMAVTFLDHHAVLKNAAGDVYIDLDDDGGVLNGNYKVQGAMLIGDVVAAVPVTLAPALVALLETFAAAVDVAIGVKSGPPASPVSPIITAGAASLSATLLKAF